MSIPCKNCCANINRGIMHKLSGGGYICDDYYENIDHEGEYYDEADEERQLGE